MKYQITRVDVRPNNERISIAKKSRIYIFIKGETILQNLFDRFSRPYDEYKTKVIPSLMKKIKKEFPLQYSHIKDDKWSWNQRAGCTCGCSPGFVGSSFSNYEIFVDVKLIREKGDEPVSK